MKLKIKFDDTLIKMCHLNLFNIIFNVSKFAIKKEAQSLRLINQVLKFFDHLQITILLTFTFFIRHLSLTNQTTFASTTDN
jgi:hypothetical protein